MDSECRCRFVLLDFGHPMDTISISNIIKSLENILALGLTFSQRIGEMTFGISVLNSDFAIFESESHLRKNYGWVVRNLNASLKTTKSSSRVTVQEYKHLLSNSIEWILRDSQKFKKTGNPCSQSTNFIQIAILTKKTASLLAEILTDVTNKLQRNFPNMPSVKNYKIVQILNKQDNNFKSSDENMLIDWTSCLDNIYDLNCFFKEWFLNQQQQVRILLLKEFNLEVECNVDNCVINPVSIAFNRRLDFLRDICRDSNSSLVRIWDRKVQELKVINQSVLLVQRMEPQIVLSGTSQPPCEMEVINRLPVRCFGIFAFGISRRLSATRSCKPCTESEVNSKLFQQICQELYRTGQGLLARATGKELNTFHLLTSDSNTLLMCDVAPEELYLPTRVTFSNSSDSSEDENAASLIRACFEKIEPLSEYKPHYFSSGVYEFLRDCLVQAAERKSLFGHFDPSVKLFGKKDASASETTDDAAASCENRKKRPKPGPEAEVENVHPALLSQDVVEKYRKIHSQAFNLPELRRDYNEGQK